MRRELDGYFPGILATELGCVVKRWEHAIPLSPPGRAIALDAFWREQHDGPGRILLAGDQTTFATLDAAARSGVVAAKGPGEARLRGEPPDALLASRTRGRCYGRRYV